MTREQAEIRREFYVARKLAARRGEAVEASQAALAAESAPSERWLRALERLRADGIEYRRALDRLARAFERDATSGAV